MTWVIQTEKAQISVLTFALLRDDGYSSHIRVYLLDINKLLIYLFTKATKVTWIAGVGGEVIPRTSRCQHVPGLAAF